MAAASRGLERPPPVAGESGILGWARDLGGVGLNAGALWLIGRSLARVGVRDAG